MTNTETTVITCTCRVCNGLSARVRGDGKWLIQPTHGKGGRKMTPTAIHNLVGLAHSNFFAVSAQQRQFGPWAV